MIECRDITRRYGTLTVLRDVSLSVSPGEIVAITGPSGAGKTTLLQIIGTIDRPTSGTVTYDGTDVTRLRDNALARFRNSSIGFIFQQHQLLPEFTLLENVALPALIAGKTRTHAYARAGELLQYLGLAERSTHHPAQLSGGECQRGAVARALMNNPAVVLADEPTGALDTRNRAELQRLFFELRRDFGHTFIIVTHDNALAADADRVITMRDGTVTTP